MHTLHCARNVALCPRCDEPFPRSQMEEHVREEHTDAECQECGAAVQRSRMGEHKVKTRFFLKKNNLGKEHFRLQMSELEKPYFYVRLCYLSSGKKIICRTILSYTVEQKSVFYNFITKF